MGIPRVPKVLTRKRTCTRDAGMGIEKNTCGLPMQFTSRKCSNIPHHFIYNTEHKNLAVLDGKQVEHIVFELAFFLPDFLFHIIT
jgi:hypothetical protein